MSFTLYLARRLSLGSGGRKSAPAVKVAVVAVALSMAVMIAAICIVTGFKKEITAKVTGFHSDMVAVVNSDALVGDDDNVVYLSESLRRVLASEPYVDKFWLEASVPGILKTSTDFKGIYYKGLEADADTSFLRDNLTSGAMPDLKTDAPQMLISELAARQLGLKPGDEVDTYFLTNDLKVRKIKVTGVYNSHFDNFDDLYVYGGLGLIRDLSGIGEGGGTAIRISTKDFSSIQDDSRNLQQRLNHAYIADEIFKPLRVYSALEQGADYFNWLGLLDTNVAVILILMTVVACITLVSALLIIILDKMRFIGILKALGARNREVGRVFVWLALRVSLVGMLIGNALMITLLYLQDKYHFLPLDADTYYIDYVPVNLDWAAIGVLNAGVFLIIGAVLILPSRFVSRMSPDKTMRYE